MSQFTPKGLRAARLMAGAAALSLLAACGEDGANFAFLQPKAETGDATPTASSSTKLVERDVEAPEVFQVEEAGLWDGRPSLGGVWVAHPDATDPERVIIRNNANGKFVIGALFRREHNIPGPRLQASSDAAAALGMLAGAPVELNVTVLRREAIEEAPLPVEEAPVVDTAALEPADSASPAEVTATALDPIAGAAAAIEAAAPAPAAAVPAVPKPAAAAPAAAAPAVASSLEKPFIQIGIFSVEANAKRTASMMRDAGMIPTVLEQSSSGKPFWRVMVGPAQNKSERAALLKNVKSTGFTDAYSVTH